MKNSGGKKGGKKRSVAPRELLLFNGDLNIYTQLCCTEAALECFIRSTQRVGESTLLIWRYPRYWCVFYVRSVEIIQRGVYTDIAV